MEKKNNFISIVVTCMVIIIGVIGVSRLEAIAAGDSSHCSISIGNVSYNTVEVKVNADASYSGIAIYRSTSQYANYKYITTIENYGSNWTYKNKNLITGQKYYYRVKAFNYVNGKKQFLRLSNPKAGTPKLEKLKIEYVNRKTSTSAQIKWRKVTGAAGYEIYSSGSKYGGYSLIKTKKGSTNIYFTNDKLICGKRYYYKARAYRVVNDKKVYGEFSNYKSVLLAPDTPLGLNMKVLSGTVARVSWNAVSNADGYQLYRSKNGGNFIKIRNTLGTNTSCDLSNMTNGNYYSFKVYSYKSINGTKVLSISSAICGAYMDYYTYDNEWYDSRYNRISQNGSTYGTRELAEMNMVNISVNVWDFDVTGNKITKQITFPINKYLSQSIVQAFKEIYEGKEKFPIHSIGGYSWRGDNSRSEHCKGTAIDINPNENCMMDNGVAVVGSFWQPYVNPYSIPTDGEVARILRKYGFYQGLWGSRNDYMHFSYFGT